jgi:hypothetical protein
MIVLLVLPSLQASEGSEGRVGGKIEKFIIQEYRIQNLRSYYQLMA